MSSPEVLAIWGSCFCGPVRTSTTSSTSGRWATEWSRRRARVGPGLLAVAEDGKAMEPSVAEKSVVVRLLSLHKLCVSGTTASRPGVSRPLAPMPASLDAQVSRRCPTWAPHSRAPSPAGMRQHNSWPSESTGTPKRWSSDAKTKTFWALHLETAWRKARISGSLMSPGRVSDGLGLGSMSVAELCQVGQTLDIFGVRGRRMLPRASTSYWEST